MEQYTEFEGVLVMESDMPPMKPTGRRETKYDALFKTVLAETCCSDNPDARREGFYCVPVKSKTQGQYVKNNMWKRATKGGFTLKSHWRSSNSCMYLRLEKDGSDEANR